jgi:hypothetical protein
MKLERLLQINIATLVALGAVLLGLSQDQATESLLFASSSTLPIIATLAAIASVVFTDILGWFYLHRHIANLTALAAVFLSVIDFANNSGVGQGQIFAIANLLVLLQAVLLFQPKNVRVYWQLCVLSLLQVVVSAALSLGFEFGVLLVLYMLVAFSALVLFYLYRETTRYGTRRGKLSEQYPVRVDIEANSDQLASQLLRGALLRQILFMALVTLSFTVVLFFSVPRSDRQQRAAEDALESQVGSSEQVDLNDLANISQSDELAFRATFRDADGKPFRPMNEPYFRGQALTQYDTRQHRWTHQDRRLFERAIPISDVAIPTLEIVRERRSRGPIHTVWPPYEVDDSTASMVIDPKSGRLLQKNNGRRVGVTESRFRVGVPTMDKGFQSAYMPHLSPFGDNYDHFGPAPAELDALLQPWGEALPEFGPPRSPRLPTLEAAAEKIIADAGIQNPTRLEKAGILRDHLTGGDFRYTLNLGSIQRTPKIAVTLNLSTIVQNFDAQDVVNLQSLKEKNLVNAAANILEVRHDGPLPFPLTLEVHRFDEETWRAMEDVEGTLVHLAELDPIEDFLVNHKSGHCEYYASALTLMLRSQGIPSRLVVGYAGGDFNSVGEFYYVRDYNAHAWVEVYLSGDDVPIGALPAGIDSVGGVWVRLDPTPAADESLSFSTGILAQFGEWLDVAQLLWSDYVLGLNSDRQQESIFKPISNFFSGIWNWLFDRESWSMAMAAVLAWLGVDPANSTGWLNWRVALAALWILLVVIGVVRLSRRVTHYLNFKNWWQAEPSKTSRVSFFEQMKRYLISIGAKPPHRGQTAREWTQQAAKYLSETTLLDTSPELSREERARAISRQATIAELLALYHEARFSGHDLPPAERSRASELLSSLAATT